MKLLSELVALAVGRVRRLWEMVRPLVVQMAVAFALDALFTVLFRPGPPSTEVVVWG